MVRTKVVADFSASASTMKLVSLMDPSADSYLGDSPYTRTKNFSEETLQLVDAETRRLIDAAYERAEGLLRENKHKLDLISDVLVQKESLEGEELERLLTNGSVEVPPAKSGTSTEE